jgi:cellulose synthase (UDP-forming)
MDMSKKVVFTTAIICYFIITVCYILARTIALQYADYSGVDKFCSIVLLVAEFYIAIHSIGYLINVISSFRASGRRNLMEEISHQIVFPEPSVAVLIPARHEPQEVLENTLLTIKNMLYKNKTIYLLDDSTEEKYRNEAEELANKLQVNLFRRKSRHGAKAGVINDCLNQVKDKYVVVFDADQCPFPEFLHKMVAIMEQDEKLALVQSPQYYTNYENTRVSKAAAHQQCVFYEYICEGKSCQDAMFCCGTNFILRKEAIDSIRGFDERCVTEDFATSLKLHQKGWKTLYYDHALAFGIGPDNLESFFKQQFRWAHGMISVWKRIFGQLFMHPASLTIRQWWEYFISSSYFFTGLIFFTLNLFPLLFIFFNVVSFYVSPAIYVLTFVPYIFLSLTIFYSMLNMRKYKARDLFAGQLLILISFPVQIKAVLSALLGFRAEFGITNKETGKVMPYSRLWPQIGLMLINFSACIWALNMFCYDRDLAQLINAFWVLYHGCILSSIFYFNTSKESP